MGATHHHADKIKDKWTKLHGVLVSPLCLSHMWKCEYEPYDGAVFALIRLHVNGMLEQQALWNAKVAASLRDEMSVTVTCCVVSVFYWKIKYLMQFPLLPVWGEDDKSAACMQFMSVWHEE